MGIVGVNLGANKDAEDRVADYIAVMRRFDGLASFFTINISSPNTERLRDLQGRLALDHLLERCLAARDGLATPAPVLLKIAPDLTEQEVADIAEVCLARGVDGIIATNTTLAREGLRGANASEVGGLSGQPLFARSTAILHLLSRHTGGAVPLIGAGGVGSAAQAYAKIRAGASLVQLYTAMVYEGVSLGARIAKGLDALLAADGFANIAEAVGADREQGG
jgi:dihydroorotate dehydrogenase